MARERCIASWMEWKREIKECELSSSSRSFSRSFIFALKQTISHISYLPKGLKQYIHNNPTDYEDYLEERKAELLFETREHRYYFHDGKIDMEEIYQTRLKDHCFDLAVLLLVDHQIGQSPPPYDAFTVAPISPDPKNYSEFQKNWCRKLWMPLTTEEEVIAMNSVWPKHGDDFLAKRLSIFGPIPRYCFADDTVGKSMEKDLENKIASFDYEKFRKSAMLANGEIHEEKTGLSWWIVHVTTDDLRVASRVSWASKYIMQQVLSNFLEKNLSSLENAIAKALDHPDILAPDLEFQYWVCLKIASGNKLKTWKPNYCGNECTLAGDLDIIFPAHDVKHVRILPKVEEMLANSGKIYYSKLSNEPLCDAAAVLNGNLILFQMTIGKTHGVKKKTLKNYCTQAKNNGLQAVKFIFVVPHKDNFRVTQENVNFFNEDFGINVYLEVAELTPKYFEIP